jgi:hypothetical protein
MTKIRVKWPKGELVAVLDDTPTAKALVAALPANRGEHLGEYFSRECGSKSALRVVGRAICLGRARSPCPAARRRCRGRSAAS